MIAYSLGMQVDKNTMYSEFLQNSNQGRLTPTKLATVHFVYAANNLLDKINLHCRRAHVNQSLVNINS